MSTFPRAGARIIHESKFVTEYDDGTEEVRFSEEEWDIMLKDPRFGYILGCGHPATASLSDGSCSICEGLMSQEQDDPSSLGELPLANEATPAISTSTDQDEIPF